MGKYSYTNEITILIYKTSKISDPQIVESIKLASEAIYGMGTKQAEIVYDEIMSTPKGYKYILRILIHNERYNI